VTQMITNPNFRTFLFGFISDFCIHAFKRQTVRKLQLPLLKRGCGSDLHYV